MYYKDDNIELRLGLGIKEFTSLLLTPLNLILSKIDYDNTYTILEVFSSENGLSDYPKDGNYSLEVSAEGLPAYNIIMTVADEFLTNFINEIKTSICDCKNCSSCKDCSDEDYIKKLVKHQRLFNTTYILPSVILPFSKGTTLTTNSFIALFIQLYFNKTIVDNKMELAQEYFNYNTSGKIVINNDLFNSVIIANYFAFYYYYKTLILMNTSDILTTKVIYYKNIVDSFFKVKDLKTCMNKYGSNIDFDSLTIEAFTSINLSTQMDQNNFSRTIEVTKENLSGNGTLEQQITEYINSLGYIKADTDSDIWIKYTDEEPLVLTS